MKKLCTYPIAFFMAALVFWGGSGMNLASYCCGDCQSKGITGLVEGACCKIHHHDHEAIHHPESDRNITDSTQEMNCSLLRIVFDWNSTVKTIINPEPVCFDLIAVHLPDGLAIPAPIIINNTFESSSGPPILCPRTYLSLLTTLLI
jgi:hypothetical protein